MVLVLVVLEDVVERVVDTDVVGMLVGVLLDVAVVDPGTVVDEGVVVGPVPPPGGVPVGLIVVVGRDGVALHVLTWRPAVREARPSC